MRGYFALVAARQLRVGVRLREALRHRPRRLRDAGARAQGQRALVPRGHRGERHPRARPLESRHGDAAAGARIVPAQALRAPPVRVVHDARSRDRRDHRDRHRARRDAQLAGRAAAGSSGSSSQCRPCSSPRSSGPRGRSRRRALAGSTARPGSNRVPLPRPYLSRSSANRALSSSGRPAARRRGCRRAARSGRPAAGTPRGPTGRSASRIPGRMCSGIDGRPCDARLGAPRRAPRRGARRRR